MKRKFTLVKVLLILAVLLTACGPSEQEAGTPKLNIPASLPGEWNLTQAGDTDWYIVGAEGIYDENTGWTVFNYDGYQIYAIFQTRPNPTSEGEWYGMVFDIQWVVDGNVIKHASCFDVDEYNEYISNGYDPRKNYDLGPLDSTGDQGGWRQALSSLDYVYGCHFDEGVDTIYFVNHHYVASSAVKQLTASAPSATPANTVTPTPTPGPGTPTAVIPTATIPVVGGQLPFACGDLSLSGAIDWSKIYTFALDCVNGRVQIRFLGDNLDRVMVQFEINQSNTQEINGYVSVPNCVLGDVTTMVGGTSKSGTTVTIECPDMGLKLTGTKQVGERIGVSNFQSPVGCGRLAMAGIIDWTKIATFALDCYNNRAQFHFRGESLDRVMVQFEKDQNGTERVDAYASVVGCKVGNEAVTPNHTAWQTKAEVTTTCADFGFEIKSTLLK